MRITGSAVLLVMFLAGCGEDPVEPVVANDVLVLTQTPRLDWHPEARFRGTLRVDEAGCLRIVAPSPDDATVVWPTGTTLWTGDGAFVVRNGFGRDMHTIGDRITFGGGYLSSLADVSDLNSGEQQSVQARCPGAYWLVTPGTIGG